MLWRVKLREKIEEDGGGKKKKKGKKSKEGRGTGGEVAEGGDGGGGAEGEVMHGATLSRSDMMKERVKKRRAVAKSQQSRSMPKVQVDENLQTSAIQVCTTPISSPTLSSPRHALPMIAPVSLPLTMLSAAGRGCVRACVYFTSLPVTVTVTVKFCACRVSYHRPTVG